MVKADKCNVVFINCDGNPSPIKLQATPKDQTRHMPPTLKKISCSDTMSSQAEQCKGDPGSVFTFECPKDCGSGGTLIGVGL
mmetsp:Transcript_43029/g.93589  ORF Transcript_43029/g.93589 Transcript_43029/m.93589 type:complete len:82 (+) Transcript_43029:1495-1740(+)